jgi:dynein heavy chain
LSETKDPLKVQPFLKKCFEGISTLEFQPNLDITAMLSVEKERVPFVKKINPKGACGNVEKWLIQIEEVMRESLKVIKIPLHVSYINVCIFNLEAILFFYQVLVQKASANYVTVPREKWILRWPGMVVLCGSQIHWTKEVADAIGNGDAGLMRYEEKCTDQLQALVKLVNTKTCYPCFGMKAYSEADMG